MESQSTSCGTIGISHSTPSRTFVGEVSSLPLITSAAMKVSATHEFLCEVVPFYEKLTSVGLSSVTILARQAKFLSPVNYTVKTVDGWGVQAIDKFKKTFPIICATSDQAQEHLQSTVQQGRKTIASLSVVQITCSATEAVLGTAEGVCCSLMITGHRMWSHMARTALPASYILVLNSTLANTSIYLEKSREAVQEWREWGASEYDTDGKLDKGTHRKSSGWWWTSSWLWNKLPYSTWTAAARETHQCPNRYFTRKRKEREDSSSDDECCMSCELQHIVSNYHSDQDQDYVPSNESTTDSLEYRSDTDVDDKGIAKKEGEENNQNCRVEEESVPNHRGGAAGNKQHQKEAEVYCGGKSQDSQGTATGTCQEVAEETSRNKVP
ncbi:hypothetical protein Pcinc_011196 [Petrolisthes cinctipes]|uniref:Uncharacterized protein n=1 Tax=Petrolisthes cinctipes TaxID=88211 RepID=A0AAE1G409_PETCI|nr:hypothetical protein Pcinc_011196 [Petrolisthes cinctipes]